MRAWRAAVEPAGQLQELRPAVLDPIGPKWRTGEGKLQGPLTLSELEDTVN